MIKAIFLDFYGTVVHEDKEIIKLICDKILKTGKAKNTAEVGAYWWKNFQNLYTNSKGACFQNQRTLECLSLKDTINHFDSSENEETLSKMMFDFWKAPTIFDDSKEFFSRCPLPIYIVSNIDTDDILQAISFHKLNPADIITSEMAMSYKPQREIFDFALSKTGFDASEVIHVGDSVKSDIEGASSVGIKAVWINRFQKSIPAEVKTAITTLPQMVDMITRNLK